MLQLQAFANLNFNTQSRSLNFIIGTYCKPSNFHRVPSFTISYRPPHIQLMRCQWQWPDPDGQQYFIATFPQPPPPQQSSPRGNKASQKQEPPPARDVQLHCEGRGCQVVEWWVSYRVTHLVGKDLPWTWIWDVLPSCLGSRPLQ